jgi:hypothetical protein
MNRSTSTQTKDIPMKTATTSKASAALKHAFTVTAARDRADRAHSNAGVTLHKAQAAYDRASARFDAAVDACIKAVEALSPEDLGRYLAVFPVVQDAAEFISGGGGQPQPPTAGGSTEDRTPPTPRGTDS